jgi:hypothetical protein
LLYGSKLVKGRATVTTLVGEEDVYGTAKEIKKKSIIV